MKQIPYEYRNLPIPGGGYVTGFLYSQTEKEVLYVRTDIGGTYRFEPNENRFVSLIGHVTMEDLSETFPISFAIDEKKPGSLYIACGENKPGKGVLAISEDYGEHFTYEKIPCLIHGNLNGRGTGERLCVDNGRLWYASQTEGLYVSDDCGANWKRIDSLQEKYLTFVGRIGKALIVGSAGVTTAVTEEGKVPVRGHSLYVSYDEGVTFLQMEEPRSTLFDGCRYQGVVAQRYCFDDRYLYVTFAATGRNSYILENGYSCDSGDSADGHIVRYLLPEKTKNGCFGEMEDITPGTASVVRGVGQENIRRGGFLEYGFSGICASLQTPGMLVASTIVKWDGDSIFRSMDYGASWQQILYDLVEGEMVFRAPYMRPEYNGGHSLIHWLSDVKINPFDDNELWFNTGTGVFRTMNLKDSCVRFTDWCDGIEETVHLNVYSMPKGPVQVIDILGDLGGFAFETLDEPCNNSFANDKGDRYITCINADYSDLRPELLVVTPRGNWTGKTFGGLILSKDQGKTFERLPMPFGISERIDEALHQMEQPNVNAGWVAMSADGKNLVWSIAEGITLPIDKVIVSKDGGQTFGKCHVFDLAGQEVTKGKLKAFSDRTDSRLFYGFGEDSHIYRSVDGGENFRECQITEEFPTIEFGLIDCANKTEVRGETGKKGIFYMAIGKGGIWKFVFEDAENAKSDVKEAIVSAGGKVTAVRLTQEGIVAYRMGLGVGRADGDYYTESKAIYFNGIVEGRYGFYRTLDEGLSYEALNTERQMYGEINSIDGDSRVFGRFYLATGSNGLKYGQPGTDR